MFGQYLFGIKGAIFTQAPSGHGALAFRHSCGVGWDAEGDLRKCGGAVGLGEVWEGQVGAWG